jgi:hypothetical protein
MLLALFEPHDHRPINVVGAQILVWPMDRPCLRRVRTIAGVDARVVVGLERVIRGEGDIGRRLTLAGQTICHERGETCRMECQNTKNSCTHACLYAPRLRLL